MNAKFIIGIDQSFKNTGICILDNRNKKPEILNILSLKAPKMMERNFDKNKTMIDFNIERIDTLIDSIIEEIELDIGEINKDVVIAIETATLNQSNSVDTIYKLGYLYMNLANRLSSTGCILLLIQPLSHKKQLFKELNKKMDKKVLYEYHWEEVFENTGVLNPFSKLFQNDDEQDAFSLSWSAYLLITSINSIINSNKKNDNLSLKKILCYNLRTNKQCAYCPYFTKDNLCLEKKERTKMRKKDQEIVDICQSSKFLI